MSQLHLNENLERLGEWHLPTDSATRIPGRLIYSPNRIQLELNSSFSPIEGDVSVADTMPSYAALHGISTKGELITLLQATRTGMSFSFGSGGIRQPETLTSSWLLLGAHVGPEEQYSSLTFFVPGLAAWLAKSPISHSIFLQETDKHHTEHFLRSNLSPEVSRLDSISASIRWGAGTSSRSNVYRRVEISVLGWFELVPDSPQPLSWFFEQHGKISSMLTLLAGTAMPVQSITAHFPDTKHTADVLVTLGDVKFCELEFPGDFYFPRDFTETPLSKLVSNWFEQVAKVLVPSQLAVSTLNSERLWLHVEFLSLAQVLEGFHRGRFPGEYMDASEYEDVKRALTTALPGTLSTDHKDSLKSRIKYGNQLSLSRRLAELAELLGTDLAIRIFGTSTKVPRSWIDTRNYHTHWDEELLKNTLQDQDLFNATIRMEHFVRALFLQLMGISAAELVRAVDHSSRCAQQLARVNIVERHRADPSQPKGLLYTVSIGPSSTQSSPPEENPERTIGEPDA